MALPWGAIVQTVGGLLGGFSANRTNVRLSRDQMRFQERMSSTAAQRAKADFEAAGLNPALAYGHTASSPSGASATVTDPVGPALSSGRAAYQQSKELQLLEQTTAKAKAEANIAKNNEALSNLERTMQIAVAAGSTKGINPDSPLFQALMAEMKARKVAADRTPDQLNALIREINARAANYGEQNRILGVDADYQEKFGMRSRVVKDIGSVIGNVIAPVTGGVFGSSAKAAKVLMEAGMKKGLPQRR